jgi:hypothetical protein
MYVLFENLRYTSPATAHQRLVSDRDRVTAAGRAALGPDEPGRPVGWRGRYGVLSAE